MKLLNEENFRSSIHGKETGLFTLRNKKGYVAQFTNYGARWVSLWMPDKNDEWADVVLGFENINGYLQDKERYYGAVVGRVCGRIDKGIFSLENVPYHLSNNDLFGEPVKNHLHGGFTGFSNRVWDAKKGRNENGEETLELTYFSKDKEEGYPGNVSVQLVYTLTDDNAVEITFTATTDQTTIITLTSHPYFNLLGNMNRNVLNHVLYINADHAIECNQHLIPTGNIISILNTPLDFTQPQAIGARLHQDFPGQLFPGKGYVVAYALNKSDPKVHLAARVEEKETGRQMEVYTDQPSLQLYTAWLFDGREKGKYGERYNAGAGLALEAQGYPDAPNHSQFPPIILKPEAVYRHKTIYRFLCESLVGL